MHSSKVKVKGTILRTCTHNNMSTYYTVTNEKKNSFILTDGTNKLQWYVTTLSFYDCFKNIFEFFILVTIESKGRFKHTFKIIFN